MAEPSVVRNTGDFTYPTVGAYVACWGYRKGYDQDGSPWREVVYHVFDEPRGAQNAGQRSDLFMDSLIGVSAQVIGPGNPVSWILPHRYPGNERLICRPPMQAEHKGAGSPDLLGKLHETSFVEILAHYEVPPYPIGPEDDPGGLSTFDGGPFPFVVTSVHRGFRDIDMPTAHKETDEDAVLDNFRVRIPEIAYRFKYVNLPTLGAEVYDALHGRVNASPFLGRAAETLLFEAPESENKRSPRGDRQNDVEFLMTWFPPGWNKHMFPGDSTFSNVVLADGTTKPYATADFSVLFQYVV